MGIEIEVNSLEDMCALMCDNVIPKKKKATKSPHRTPLRQGQATKTPKKDVKQL